MNILITGASGFIGKHLVLKLKQTNNNLFLLTRNPRKMDEHISKMCQIVKGDLCDRDSLIAGLKNMDLVINIAGEIRDKDKLYETNVNGTKNLLNAIELNKVPKVIHISSVGVVGMQYSLSSVEVDEDFACNPKNKYEETKLISEDLFKEAGKNDLQVVILRPTNVFGEGHPNNAMLRLLRHCSKQKPIVCTRKAVYNYVYVGDVVRFICSVIEQNTKGVNIFNVGQSIHISDFIKILNKNIGHKSKIIFMPPWLIKMVRGLGLNFLNSFSNAVSYTNQKTKLSYQTEKGITNTIKYFKTKGLL